MRFQTIIICSILLFVSCKKENLKQQLDETIYVRHKGADMPAYVHGNSNEKVFVLVLHGAGSFGLSFRDENFINDLEDKFVMVYFDQRAQSMSQGNYKKPNDLIDHMSSDIEALTKVLKYKYGEDIKLFLMGHSWGGLLSAATLLREGVQDDYLGWINVDGVMSVPEASEQRADWINKIANEEISRNKSVANWQSIKLDIADLSAPHNDREYDEVLQLAAKGYTLLVKDGTVQNYVSAEKLYQTIIKNNPITWQISHLFNKPVEYAKDVDYSLLDRLDQITIPVLFIYGKYDLSVPPSSGDEAFDEVRSIHKELKIYQSSMHHPFDTEPNAFVNDVIRFVNTHK